VPVGDPDIDRYCEEHTTPPPPWLRAVARETHEQLDAPQMLTGTVEGRFLEMLVWTSAARRVLEIGTFSGYSALSMAAALPEDGLIVSCEIDERRAEFARRHIDASPHAAKIDVRVGPALDTIGELEGRFDLVFVDADKTGYAGYVDAALPLLAPRGLIVIDNTLWSGRVLDPDPGDESTVALAALNDRLAGDDRLVVVQLPVRDGVTLVRRAG
jgi:caffeoyl-CoA O-methyltransferase